MKKYFVALRRLGCIAAITRAKAVDSTTEGLFVSRPDLAGTIERLRGRVKVAVFRQAGHKVIVSGRKRAFLKCTERILRRTTLLRRACGGGTKQGRRFDISARRCSFTIGTFIRLVRQCKDRGCSFYLQRARACRVVRSITRVGDRVKVLCLGSFGHAMLRGLVGRRSLIFARLFITGPRVFIDAGGPLTNGGSIAVRRLRPCPCLSFRRKRRGSFCFSRRVFDAISQPGGVHIESQTALFGLLVNLGNCAIYDKIVSRRLGKRGVISIPLRTRKGVRVNVIARGGILPDHLKTVCQRTLMQCARRGVWLVGGVAANS